MPASPTTKKGVATRDKILRAAGQVFARDGYVETRMTDIATEAGLSTGGLYRYFDNKTEVLSTLVADIHEHFYDASGHTRQLLATDPLRALTQANQGYIEYYYENREVMRVFVEAASIDERFRDILQSMRDRHIQRFITAFAHVSEAETIRGVPVQNLIEAMTCMVEQCCYVWFAQEKNRRSKVSIDNAVAATSQAWYATMFANGPADVEV
jgi:AcrR family transcriptional regulator